MSNYRISIVTAVETNIYIYHQHRPMGKIKVFWQNPGFKLCDPYSEWDHRKPGFGISSRPVWGQWLHQEAILADPMLGWDLSVSLTLY